MRERERERDSKRAPVPMTPGRALVGMTPGRALVGTIDLSCASRTASQSGAAASSSASVQNKPLPDLLAVPAAEASLGTGEQEDLEFKYDTFKHLESLQIECRAWDEASKTNKGYAREGEADVLSCVQPMGNSRAFPYSAAQAAGRALQRHLQTRGS